MMLIILGQLISLAMGCLLVWSLGPWTLRTDHSQNVQAINKRFTLGRNVHAGKVVLALAASLLAGIGLAGLSAWIHLLLSLNLHLPLMAVDIFMLIVLACAMLFCRSRRSAAKTRIPSVVTSDDDALQTKVGRYSKVTRWVLTGWGVLILAYGLSAAWINEIRRPWGDWDAIMIWNARARFMDRAAELWPIGFKLPVIHPDYPILLPASVYRLWQYQQGESPFASQLVSMVFLVSGMMMLWAALRICRGSVIAWIGLLVLIANPFYMNFGSLQLADVPVGTFLLAGWALVAVAAHEQKQNTQIAVTDLSKTNTIQWTTYATLALAGLMFGCMAWVKNEGLLMLLCTGLGLLITRKPAQWLKGDWRLLVSLAAGAVMFVAAIFWAKLMLTGSNDLIRGQSGAASALEKLIDPTRHAAIFNAYWQFLKANPALWSSVLLVALLPIAGWRLRRRELGLCLLGMGAAIFLIVAGYYTVYLLTPLDLKWHLSTSLSRLLTQVWPAFVLWAMLGLRLPGWGKPSQHEKRQLSA